MQKFGIVVTMLSYKVTLPQAQIALDNDQKWVNFEYFVMQDGYRPQYWKLLNQKNSAIVWPITAKDGTMTHIDPVNPTESKNFKLKNPTW